MSDTKPNRRALLLGATGLVGRQVLDGLLDDDTWTSVVAPGRRPLERDHGKLDAPVIDFERIDDADRAGGPFDVDDVFCCLGTTIKKAGSEDAFRRVDFVYPLEAARLVAGRGADQFLLVSSLGANPTARAFYSRVKGEVEAAIGRLPFGGYHIFRPSLLLGDRDEVRVAERLAIGVSQALIFAMIGPLQRYRPIDGGAVARAMVAVARRGERGRHVYPSERIRALGR